MGREEWFFCAGASLGGITLHAYPFLGSLDRAVWMWTGASSAVGCLTGHGSAAPPYSAPIIMNYESAICCVDAAIKLS